jgi:hypothetical protein
MATWAQRSLTPDFGTPRGRRIFVYIPGNARQGPRQFHACPICEGRGKVPSRLPARTRPCDACAGRGVVTPIRRQQLLAKLKAKEQERG